MKKTDRKTKKTKAPKLRLVDSLAEQMREDLREFVHTAGMNALKVMLEQDRDALCGPAYGRGRKAGPQRAGSTTGELVLGGRRARVRRPRVRDEDGEVLLSTWEAFSDEDPLNERAHEQMVIGVSTRKYSRSLEAVPEELETRGTSRSAVSRRFKAATQKQVDELIARDLGDLKLVSIMLDGIHIAEHVILLAVGIAEDGRKHVLGLWEGASENKVVCMTMLNSLVARNLDPQRSCLFVIDGSKALRGAIRDVFGSRALIQRCQVHKRRNVLGHLPKALHASVGKGIRDAYAAPSKAAAKKRLLALSSQLEEKHPSASASLKEGLDETLTLKGVGLSKALERTLSTTNIIENLNGGVRDISRRVKQWRGGSMICRWVAAAVLEREASFRRLRGYRGLNKLVVALRANDTRIDAHLEPEAFAS